jgi:hypothetical protein
MFVAEWKTLSRRVPSGLTRLHPTENRLHPKAYLNEVTKELTKIKRAEKRESNNAY